MRSERGLSTIPHCLEWYKFFVLRTRLPILAVRHRSSIGFTEIKLQAFVLVCVPYRAV